MTTEICRLTIPVNLSLTSPNRRQHWAALHKAKKVMRQAAEAAWLIAGRPRSKSPVVVSVMARCWKPTDADNILASLKACWDGLFNGAITPDDSPAWVSFGAIEQINGPKWRLKPEVEIIVALPQPKPARRRARSKSSEVAR